MQTAFIKKYAGFSALLLTTAFILYSCVASDVGSARRNEKLHMNIKEQRDIISSDRLKSQAVLSLDQRADAERNGTRGAIAPVATTLVSLAADGIKKIIANDQKKYLATYQFGLTDLYFYDQLSNDGPFDPVGMQFSGFKLIRTFKNDAGVEDTALIADFALDTLRSFEIINNSMFRLRVKDFQLRYAKARVPKSDKKKLNMDFEITFLTSYVNSQGMIFDSVVLGKFYLLLRDAPLDRNDVKYQSYYANLKDSLLSGKSFIVPRSFGYHREPDDQTRPGYSQGAYSILVKVKESSKDHFINKLVVENANLMIDASSNQLKSLPLIKKL
ncbi:MAG TPA: hypothetical protein VKT28_02705 [Puia sp.]|nr:hypothetical protein [Puia sp.]